MHAITSTTKNPDGTLTITSTVTALITFKDAADMLGLSRQHVIDLVHQGQLNDVEHSGHIMVRSHDVVDFRTAQLKRQRQAAIELMELTDELGMDGDPLPA